MNLFHLLSQIILKKCLKKTLHKLGVPNPYDEAENAIDSLSDVMSEISLTDPVWPDLTELFNMAPVFQACNKIYSKHHQEQLK